MTAYFDVLPSVGLCICLDAHKLLCCVECCASLLECLLRPCWCLAHVVLAAPPLHHAGGDVLLHVHTQVAAVIFFTSGCCPVLDVMLFAQVLPASNKYWGLLMMLRQHVHLPSNWLLMS